MAARVTTEVDRSLARHVRLSGMFTFGAVFPLFLFGAMSVDIQSDLGFGTSELGYAGAAFFAGGGLTALGAGARIDRVGTRAALRIAMAFSFGATVLIAIVATSWWVAAVGIAMCGVSHALTQLALNRMLAVGQSRGSGALVFGIKQAAVPAVSLIAGFTSALLAPSVSWRLIYLLGSIVTLLLGVLAPPTAGDSGQTKTKTATSTSSLRRLALAAALAASAGNALSLLVVDSFDANSFDASVGALALGIGSGLAVAARIGSGWLAERRRSDGVREFRFLLVVGSCGFALLSVAGGSIAALFVGTSVAFMAGWGWQGLAFFSAVSLNRSIPPATSTGVVLSGTMGGSVVGPIVIGAAADHYGYGRAWMIGAAALILAAVCVSRLGDHTTPFQTPTDSKKEHHGGTQE